MNLDAIGNIAELISAIGVVATLAYLSIQIRQSSATSRANIRQQLAGQQIEYLKLLITEPTLRAAIAKVIAGEPPTPDESQVYATFAIAGLRLFESCHAQWEYGTLTDEDWVAVLARYEGLFGRRVYSQEFLRRPATFNPRFAALVQSIIEKSRDA